MNTFTTLIVLALAATNHAFQPTKVVKPATPKLSSSIELDYNEASVASLLEEPDSNTNSQPIDGGEPIMVAARVPATTTMEAMNTVDLTQISNVLTPAEAFEALVHKGEVTAQASLEKNFFSSVLAGCYVGMGAMVSLAVAGNSPDLVADPGLQKFLFAALFPVNLLLALQCGGQMYTGNTANLAAAVCESRASLGDMGRVLATSWIGNACGAVTFAFACKYAGVLDGGAGQLAAVTLATKTSYELGPLMVKAMFCNWLVCLAVYLSLQAKDMGGKYLSIWLPVSTFVSIGFEHSVANMFLLPAGLLSTDEISPQTALFHNLLPVSLGNAVSGALFVGAAMSYLYGSLGEEKE